MQIPSFFKTVKNRQFAYRPIFYNPAGEELRERIKKMENEHKEVNCEGYKIGINRGSIRQHSKIKKRTVNRTNYRLAIITLILLGLAWYLLYK
jgi:hypothetical protein